MFLKFTADQGLFFLAREKDIILSAKFLRLGLTIYFDYGTFLE